MNGSTRVLLIIAAWPHWPSISVSRLLGATSVCLVLAGCQTVPTVSPKLTVPSLPPRIHNIGTQSILTFEGVNKPGAAPIYINIYGQGLDRTKDNSLAVQITGTVSIAESEYAKTVMAREDIISIEVARSYVNRLKTGDRLEVAVSVNAKDGLANGQSSPVSFARRVFTLYETDDYRRILAGRVPVNDIEAFPLPETEARHLFGRLIAKNYFVVKLSLRNSVTDEKLVNVGMISATGSAMVQPQDDKDGQERIYTVPVRVSPQSPLQVYAVLDGRENAQPRAQWFRGLEFIGSLGTAVAASFTHTPPDLVKGISLFTGVGLPEGRKLWPDNWPGYKRNLVNFSLPELVKVPKLSATAPKFIFFSKLDLELVVADQNLFEVTTGRWFLGKKVQRLGDVATPSVRVISLSFDNLDIPFETVTTPETGDVLEDLDILQRDLPLYQERLQICQLRWMGGLQLTEGASFSQMRAVVDSLERANGAPAIKALDEKDKLKPALADLAKLAKWLSEANDATTPLPKALFYNTGQDVPSLADLATSSLEISTLQRRALANSDRSLLKDRLGHIKNRLAASRLLLEFILTSAGMLTDPVFLKNIEALAKLDAEKLKKDDSPERQQVLSLYASLRQQRSMKVLPDFASDEYKKLAAE